MSVKIPNDLHGDVVFIQRDYICLNSGGDCGAEFVVHHTDKTSIKANCGWCGSPVREMVEKYEDCPVCGKYATQDIASDGNKYCLGCWVKDRAVKNKKD